MTGVGVLVEVGKGVAVGGTNATWVGLSVEVGTGLVVGFVVGVPSGKYPKYSSSFLSTSSSDTVIHVFQLRIGSGGLQPNNPMQIDPRFPVPAGS
jgi:hypothetical protein